MQVQGIRNVRGIPKLRRITKLKRIINYRNRLIEAVNFLDLNRKVCPGSFFKLKVGLLSRLS